ncbi:MAG: glycosyltransferase [Parafilimonas sp.]|nr:glycosyltransferase [Parafilimonas sp.]
MKVLWLTSWYPNKINPTNGDFVQRHAQATSLFCKVDVIHVEKDSRSVLNQSVEINKNAEGNLTETIVLFKENKLALVGKFFSLLKYKKFYKQQVENYIEKNGLPDLVHVQIAMKAGIIALWIKKKFGVRYMITDQWTIYNSTAKDAYEKRSIIFKNFTKEIFSNAILFISVSKNLVDTIAKKITQLPFTIVYNVVNTNNFFYSEKKKEHFTFVHASTLGEQKNPEAIIDAFIAFNKKHPCTRLLLIGDTPDALKNYLAQKNLAQNIIEFTGFIPYEKLGDVVQQCHAFVLFSRRENMPCVVAEALCCGLPVITSNAGGTAEVINAENGIVVYDYTTVALTQAMIQLYENYNQYNQKNIADESASKFNYNIIGKQITDAYKSILNNNYAD